MPVWRLLPLLCVAWLALSPARTAAAETITVSQMENDTLSAQAFAIIREAYRRLGIDLQAVPLPRERALMFSDSGETSGEVIRMAGIETLYPNLVRVPEPVVTFDTVAFTTGLSFAVNGWESLRPYRLCVLRGMKLAEMGTDGMQRILANSNGQIIRMLVAGRCEVAVLGYQIWREIEPHLKDSLRALEPPIVSVPLYHYLHRNHADLAPQVAETMRQMRADGTTARLLAGQDAPPAR